MEVGQLYKIQVLSIMNNKLIVRLIGAIVIIVLLFFQFKKRANDLRIINEKKNLIEKENFSYVKLLDQLPIYRDSVYKIYIANIEGDCKIIFLKKDSISEVQKKSKFFLHIYPQKDSLLIDSKSKLLAFDFYNNVSEFNYNQEKYFISSTTLPNFLIEKINTGQYGYEGDFAISWEIKDLLYLKSIKENLKFNKEKCNNFL